MLRLAAPQRRTANPLRTPRLTKARNELLRDLARAEAQLAALDRSRDEMRARIESLRAELDSTPALSLVSPQLSLVPSSRLPQTSADKVKLFRSLFRGRTDVFPTR